MLNGFVLRLKNVPYIEFCIHVECGIFIMIHMLFLQKLVNSSLWDVWKLFQSCDCLDCLCVGIYGFLVRYFEPVFLCVVRFGFLARNNRFVLLIVPSYSHIIFPCESIDVVYLVFVVYYGFLWFLLSSLQGICAVYDLTQQVLVFYDCISCLWLH